MRGILTILGIAASGIPRDNRRLQNRACPPLACRRAGKASEGIYLVRAQCAYLSEEEECRIIEAVEKQYGSPKFLASLPDAVVPATSEPQPDAAG